MELKSSAFLRSIDSKSTEATAPAFQLGAAIKLAASRSGYTCSQLAAHMDGLDPGTFSKQLDGDGHLALNRLLKCPDAFWHELLPILAERYGMAISHSAGVSRSLARFLEAAADVVSRMELHVQDQKAG